MGEVMETKMQTPIEIALGIDEQGMTTARKLYAFLELDPSHFARWAKKNVEDNEYFKENVDWWGFAIVANGNKCKDYKLTTEFAKHLSMTGQSAKGKIARDYFIAIENEAKQLVANREQLSPQTQALFAITESIARTELEQKRQAEKIERLESEAEKQGETIQTIKDTFSNSDSEEETSKWINQCIGQIANSPNFSYSYGNKYSAARNESYEKLKTRAGCRLDQKLRNAISRAQEKGYTKAQIDKINKLTVIMADKRLKQIYIGVIKEMMIQYCA